MSKIVVVDDSYAELQLIEGLLKGASHTVVSYPNTEKLEEKLLIERPDAIVLDVVMPGLGGPETWERMQGMRPGLRVLFTSGYADDHYRQRLPAGAELLEKPFRPEDLLRRVRKTLGEA